MGDLVKTVTVRLDKPRNLRLTLGDARRFLEATKTQERPQGISIIRGDLAEVSLDEEQWIELFACCLRHEDPELTTAQLEEMIDLDRFHELGRAFHELMDAYFPVPDEDPTTATT